jgi:hypothetical protein
MQKYVDNAMKIGQRLGLEHNQNERNQPG